METNFYKEYNKDLSHFTVVELLKHYENFGINEGRIFFQEQLNIREYINEYIKNKKYKIYI